MKKFYISDVPDKHTMTSWIKENTNWIKLMQSMRPQKTLPPLLCFKIDNFNPAELAEDIINAMEIYGEHGWKSSGGEAKVYTGFSLVYNPNQLDNLNPHSSTLGTPQNSINEFYWNRTENHNILKNSYFDGYGFNVPTPASEYKSIGKFMSRGLRTRVRSRLSIINGMYSDQATRVWHKDEPIFENLRINVPITTSPHYMFDLENYPPVNLPVGKAYSWNTHIPHRVYPKDDTIDNSRRIHFVLGYSPWWNYLPDEQAWVQNEFYGEKHPFDMLIEGDVFSGLEFDSSFSLY